MLAEAVAGWLVAAAGQKVAGAGRRALLGTAVEKDLRVAIRSVLDRVTAQLPPAAREPLAAALAERFDQPEEMVFAEGESLHMALASGLRRRLLPLADPEITGIGSSFLATIDVDADWLLTELTAGLISAIKAVAANQSITQLAAQLNADAIRADLATLHERAGRSSPAPAVDNLPPISAHLVGRGTELAQLRAVAEHSADAPVLQTIDGMPGVGKTALALRAAQELTARYPDARLYLNLQTQRRDRLEPLNPADALEALLVVLGVEQVPESVSARAAVWRAELSKRRMLVVLDNAADETQVEPLLPGSPHSLALVTSRRRLAGLDATASVTLDTLAKAPATELLTSLIGTERARTDPAALDTIVTACAGLPLAVHLVAGRLRRRRTLRMTTVAKELASTRDRLSRIRAGNQHLAAVFEVSLAAVADDARNLFRLLALMPGHDYTAFAAATIADLDHRHAADLLEELFDHNLLHEVADGRYHMHDLVHEYGQLLVARGNASAHETAVTRSMREYVRAGRAASTTTWTPVELGEARELLDTEWHNLLAWTAFAAERDMWPVTSDLAAVSANYLPAGEPLGETHRVQQLVYDAAQGTGAPIPVASATYRLGLIENMRGRHHEASTYLREAASQFDTLNDGISRANAAHHLGLAQRALHDTSSARNWLNRALTWHYAAGNRPGEIEALAELANLELTTDSPGQALLHFQRLRALSSGDITTWSPSAVLSLAKLELLSRATEHAEQCGEAALHGFRHIGDRRGEAAAHRLLSQVAQAQDDLAGATSHLEQALTVFEDLDDDDAIATHLHELGRLRLAAGDHLVANRCLTEALRLTTRAGLKRTDIRISLAELARATGDHDTAIARCHEALAGLKLRGARERIGKLRTLLQDLEGGAAAQQVANSWVAHRGVPWRPHRAEELAALERKLFGVFGRDFTALRGSGCYPPQVVDGLAGFISEKLWVDEDGPPFAPNHFIVELSPHDYSVVHRHASELTQWLTVTLSYEVVERGWRPFGAIVIKIAPNEKVHHNRFWVSARIVTDQNPS